ncbi:MAG: FtsX-like permease family protein [Pseudomonadota bacterium]
MTRTALSALFSHWRRNPLQLAALVLGLAFATALWSGVQAINAEARASYASAASALGSSRPVLTGTTGTVDQDTYVALRRAGWLVSPVVEGWLPAAGGRVRLLGIDPLTAPPDAQAAGVVLSDDLSAFRGTGLILAAPDTASRLTAPGLPPVRATAGLAPGIAFVDIGVAQRLLDMQGTLTHLIMLNDQPLARTPLDAIAPELQIREGDTEAELARLTDSFHLNLTAFGFLSFAVGLFIVHGAIGLAFEQRRPLFRTLRAIGVPRGRLIGLAMAELLVFAILAGGLGVALGYLIAVALIPDVAATLRGLYGVPVEGALSLRPAWWAVGFAIAIAGTAVAGAGTLLKLAALPLLAPARPRAWARAGRLTAQAQGAGALLLGALAAGLIAWASGLVAGFAMLGALLLSAALALPLVLSSVLTIAARTARGATLQWFWADTRQQLPGLSLALMALLLALAANIGVGTMVSSFRLTFTGWLDQRLASELYVTAKTPEQAHALTEWLAPRTDAVLPIWDVETEILGAPATIYGVADHATYRNNWPILSALPDAWDLVANGQAIMINEQLALREGLSPGDPIILPQGWNTVVAATYSDYGNPTAQVLISVSELTKRFPNVERLRFGVRISPSEVDDLIRALTDEFGLPLGNMTDQASIKAFSLRVFERTFTVTGALNVLTLAVAGFAILTSLLTLASLRLPQLAPAWAMGLTRRQLAALELARAALLACLTALAALPVGLMLAWVLLAVINVEAFGWRLPMYVFPGQWIALLGLALMAAGLAALIPALRLARRSPSQILKVFANER